MEKQGYIQIYTGNGKGKTTAAIGLCIRAIGYQKRVAFMQFLKNGKSGECAILKQLGVVMLDGVAPTLPPWNEAVQDQWKTYTRKQWNQVKEWLNDDFDVIVLDELLGAWNKKFILEEEIFGFLSVKPQNIEIIMTGRNAPESLIKKANLVTSMEEIKHYFQEGVPAREGIEY